MIGRFALRELRGGQLELPSVRLEIGPEAGQPGQHLVGRGMGCARLLLQGVLGDVDVDGSWASGPGDMEGLGEDPRQVVGVPDEVVVLRHRQRDAVDVDLLEGVLSEEGPGHVAGDRDHRDRVEEGCADSGHEVRGARTRGAHAHADPSGHAGVAIGGVGTALLVANEDVPQLRIVAEDVVQRQDHAARVAEEDVDALSHQGLANDVGPDPGPPSRPGVVEHLAPGALDRDCSRRPVAGDVAAALGRARTRRLRRALLGDRHRWAPSVIRRKQKTLATRRGSLRSSVVWSVSCARPSEFLRSPAGSR